MRHVLRLLLLMLILTPFALAALVWFSLSPHPAATPGAGASHEDIARAKRVLEMNDPRAFPPGTAHRVTMTEQDINLALNHALRKLNRGSARVAVRSGQMELMGTLELPLISSRPYLNVTARIEASNGQPRISRLRVGALPVPPALAMWALEQAAQGANLAREYRLAGEMIQRLELRPGVASVEYRWQPETLRTLGAQLAGIDAAALAAYHAQLLALHSSGAARDGSVTVLLQSMFSFAQQRSAGGGDPVAENRALFLILGAWASGRDLRTLVPQAPDRPARFALRLQQRRDIGQHFLVSAAMAAGGDAGLSDAIGIQKEIADTQGGSGFSFTDLAADRAGTRFGRLATASPDQARQIQQLFSRGLMEGDIMPSLTGLPEGLTEAEFISRYSAVGSPAYQAVLDEIERRIAACPLYRG